MAEEAKAWLENFWEELVVVKKNKTAIRILEENNLKLPLDLLGDTCDELRAFTHAPQCECHNCLKRPHEREITRARWEGQAVCVSLSCDVIASFF